MIFLNNYDDDCVDQIPFHNNIKVNTIIIIIVSLTYYYIILVKITESIYMYTCLFKHMYMKALYLTVQYMQVLMDLYGSPVSRTTHLSGQSGRDMYTVHRTLYYVQLAMYVTTVRTETTKTRCNYSPEISQ